MMVTSFLKTLPTGKETATTIQVCLMLEEQKREEAKGKMIFGNAILNGVVRKYFSDKVIGKQRYKNLS